ncbi:PRC-barrel domain-containing protein [Wenxinia saemankumensis]|uniref:PRC-barrel domain-containing protein n=1 Tax=Wenxinia saemankumensis TaxID=1447782 RepID=A0A1M6G3M5_9RHOB|nr:PRC-barrel domain-containing protein [Wenxinia saemankumensis]SHJ04563.1 PRC-barrel domain-containing protein [Wenxinia saemankumensis]
MRITSLFASAAIVALTSAPVLAQDATAPVADPTMDQTAPAMDPATDPIDGTAAEPTAPAFTSLDEMTVGDVLGMSVESPDGENIGDVDYVIQTADGLAAVIGIGGFLGLGEYTVALPLDEFQLNEDFTAFTLGTTREALEAQPEFDESGIESLEDELVVGDLMAQSGDGSGAMTEDTATEGTASDEAGDMATGDGAMDGAAADDGAAEVEAEPMEPAADDAATGEAAPDDAAMDEAPAEVEETESN